MKFGFDIDDTLINLREYAFHIYNKKLNQNVDVELFRNLGKIEIHELFGMNAEQGYQMWRSNMEEIYFTDCPQFPGAAETLQKLASEGHEIYYITARPAEYGERTLAWMAENRFPMDPGKFFCGMEDREKVKVIQELNLDYYVDDKPTVLNTLVHLPLRLLVKDHPYNRHLDIPRIRNWPDLPDLLRI